MERGPDKPLLFVNETTTPLARNMNKADVVVGTSPAEALAAAKSVAKANVEALQEQGLSEPQAVHQTLQGMLEGQSLREKTGQVVLVVDATGSMQPFLNNLKKVIMSLVIDSLSTMFSNGFSVRIILYADLGRETTASESIEFNGIDRKDAGLNRPGLAQLSQYMDTNFVAGGGGDDAEWLNSGMKFAIKDTRWSPHASTKLICVFTDETNHGVENHGEPGVYDTYPMGLNSRGERETMHSQAEMKELLEEFSKDQCKHLHLFKLLPREDEPSYAKQDQLLSRMADNWKSILKSVGCARVSERVNSWSIPDGKTDAPKIFEKIKTSLVLASKKSITESKKALADAPAAKVAIALGSFLDSVAEGGGMNGGANLDQYMDSETLSLLASISEGGRGRRSRSNVRRSYNRANNKSVAKKLKRFISRKYGLRRKSIAKNFFKHL